MAEGSVSYKGNAINSVTINTKRLTEGDNKLLSDFIKLRFDIDCTVNKSKNISWIRVKGKSVYKFFEFIKPYILSDFLYKIPNDELLLKYKQDGEIV
jgi:hypothetical protein